MVARERSGVLQWVASSLRVACGVVAAVAVVSITGCGGVFYAVEAGSASSKLEQARQQDAEHKSPYHYFLAQEYLKKASEEAANADYSDAIDLAEAAESEASQAISDVSPRSSKGSSK